MPVPALCRMIVCDNRMDLLGVAGHGASLTASISRGRHAGTRRSCNMARRVCVPSLRSHRFQRFRIVSHKCNLWPTESGPVSTLQTNIQFAEQSAEDRCRCGSYRRGATRNLDSFVIGSVHRLYRLISRAYDRKCTVWSHGAFRAPQFSDTA